MLYGNIGASARLDFTVLGPTVNLTARLEGLAARLGRDLVVSSDFAARCEAPFVCPCTFEFKGVGEVEGVVPYT